MKLDGGDVEGARVDIGRAEGDGVGMWEKDRVRIAGEAGEDVSTEVLGRVLVDTRMRFA